MLLTVLYSWEKQTAASLYLFISPLFKKKKRFAAAIKLVSKGMVTDKGISAVLEDP